LNQAANDLEKQMRTVAGLVEVNSTASLVKPEILIIPAPARAADLGVTVQAIARTASLATIGDNEANLANLIWRRSPNSNSGFKIAPKEREDINHDQKSQVPGDNGTLVPLVAVADLRFGSGPAQINRYDRSRQVSVEANLQGIALGDAAAAVNKLPALIRYRPESCSNPLVMPRL
jgi:multidrug efflux pump subunit AcrB